MTFLDICAGMGGFSLGLSAAGMECKGQVEINDYCFKILKKWWPNVPKWRDLKHIAQTPELLPPVELISAGMPCQPTSLAGQRKGQNDDRWLWPYLFKILAYLRPPWFVGENVAGIVTLGLDLALSDLESIGYSTITFEIPACAVEAPHERNRVWFVAYADKADRRQSESAGDDAYRQIAEWTKTANRPGASGAHGGTGLLDNSGGMRRLQPEGYEPEQRRRPDHSCAQNNGIVTNSGSIGLPDGLRQYRSRRETAPTSKGHALAGSYRHRNLPQPGLDGGPYGLSAWLDSIRTGWRNGTWEEGLPRTVAPRMPNRKKRCEAIGNAVVPQVVYEIGRAIMAAHYYSLEQ